MTPGQAATTAVSYRRPGRLKQCGASLSADARKLTRSGTLSARLHDQLVELVRSGVPVALRVHGLDGCDALRRYYDACRDLRDTFARSGIDPRLLELTLDAGSLPLCTAWRVRRYLLGNGIVNVTFSAAPQHGAKPTSHADTIWHDLWHLRSTPVRSAFWPTVRSACKLLSPEQGTGIVPGCGLQAPDQSAWVRAELDLRAFADGAGCVDVAEMTAAVASLMDEADDAIDTASWATSAMQHDAWYSRRLAIVPVGIGDIAKRRGLDPERHRSLASMRELLSAIRLAVKSRSRMSAMRHERLPSLTASNPCLHLPAGARESCWEQRWHTALERQALRHRNLLALSPWSLFPRGSADFRYANFLPLLTYADACEFRRTVSLATWTVRQLKLFHCRAWALNNAVMSSAIIADQP